MDLAVILWIICKKNIYILFLMQKRTNVLICCFENVILLVKRRLRKKGKKYEQFKDL